ncbi:hypothetical protein [Halalkalibacter wakoensis]|nr:hypothetical protein [Halalkalibacter wakoensis]
MFKSVDWQMVAFVGGSLLIEFLRYSHVPRIYYFQQTTDDDEEDDRAA